MLHFLKQILYKFRDDQLVSEWVFRQAHALYAQGSVKMLSRLGNTFAFQVQDTYEDLSVKLIVEGESLRKESSGRSGWWDAPAIAALMQLIAELSRSEDNMPNTPQPGIRYTREGMKKRVLAERQERADNARYIFQMGGNLFGEHQLISESGRHYRLTFRDFTQETGYCSCPDYRTNKLGTCKHLMFAFRWVKQHKNITEELVGQDYPFVDIYLDPLQGYQPACFHPERLSPEVSSLLANYFHEGRLRNDKSIIDMAHFIEQARAYRQILIRPEVVAKVERAFNQQELQKISKSSKLNFSLLKKPLFPYQHEGVERATFSEGLILADETGLGKTVQAIATAVMKKDLLSFRNFLVVCPASLKAQWKHEIKRFSHESATVVQGSQAERMALYQSHTDGFLIINYETLLRDAEILSRQHYDFMIVDEAQRIRNFATQTAHALKNIVRRHVLILTGTPLEKKLIDIYSITELADPELLSPLWDFSYRYCLLDDRQALKITGYQHLDQLRERLKPIMLRREKQQVLAQLPQASESWLPVAMCKEQWELQKILARQLNDLLHKKPRTAFDEQRIWQLLAKIRMLCNAAVLADDAAPSFSPKLSELRYLLSEKIGLPQQARKVVIFSEWVKANTMIARLLEDLSISFVALHGQVPVKQREVLIAKFENDPECMVFLATETGGVGLNLQVADILINFDWPLSTTRREQRLGRIDRLGQRSRHLSIISLIARDSIEEKIAQGMLQPPPLSETLFGSAEQVEVRQSLDQLAEAVAQLLAAPTPAFYEIHHSDPEVSLYPVQNTPGVDTMKGQVIYEGLSSEVLTKVMEQGMFFLGGLIHTLTGHAIAQEESKIDINRETGELILRFKLHHNTSS